MLGASSDFFLFAVRVIPNDISDQAIDKRNFVGVLFGRGLHLRRAPLLFSFREPTKLVRTPKEQVKQQAYEIFHFFSV